MNRLVLLTVPGLFCTIKRRGECYQHIATPDQKPTYQRGVTNG